MRVKVGELKAKLSSYLRQIGENGESIEVCVREQAVAYLVPTTVGKSEGLDLAIQRLRARGLVAREASLKAGVVEVPMPRKAGDGKVGISTMDEMRKERDW